MVVVADKAGQLGNRLLVFANLIATAIEGGFSVANPAFDEYAGSFEGSRGDPLVRFPARRARLGFPGGGRVVYGLSRVAAWLVARFPSRKLPLVGLLRVDAGDRADLSAAPVRAFLKRRGIVLVQGWLLRDWPAVRAHAGVVKEYFTPIAPYSTRAMELAAAARASGDQLIGIHIRQSDYAGHLGGRFFYPTESYVQLMQQVRDAASGTVRFLVCSDVQQDEHRFTDLPCTFGSGDAMVDLYALSACDRLIGPPSSFTNWASFYGNVPLHAVVNPGESPTPDSYRVFPDIDERVGALY